MNNRETERRTAVRRLVAGTVLAVVSTAAMVAVTLPMDASGDGGPTRAASSAAPTAAYPSEAASPSGTGTGTDTDNGSGTGTGIGDDPLTDGGIARARQAALAGDRTLRTGSEDVRGRGEAQFLGADLAEGGTRRADVLFYDYRGERLVKKTVDLATGRVERTESATGVQPAPSGEESREALRVLLASRLGDGVRQDFRAATGQSLVSAGRELRVQGLVYDSPPRGAAADLAACTGAHRCVRLFTRVADGPWIDTRGFVIDLSARSVHRTGE